MLFRSVARRLGSSYGGTLCIISCPPNSTATRETLDDTDLGALAKHDQDPTANCTRLRSGVIAIVV
jgi:hypothetical protein